MSRIVGFGFRPLNLGPMPSVVVPREVVNAGLRGRGLRCHCGVCGDCRQVDPVLVGRCAGFVAKVGVGVCPFGCQRAVEAFDFAVRLGSVRPCPEVFDLDAKRLGEVVGSVARTVVGHHGRDRDAGVGEELSRSFPEPGSGLFAFVGQDFGIGQPGMVIDGVVQERVAVTLTSCCCGCPPFVRACDGRLRRVSDRVS